MNYCGRFATRFTNPFAENKELSTGVRVLHPFMGGGSKMIEQFSTDDRNNIRRCLHQYVSLARRLRDGKDIMEELRDDFERQSFNPVCLLTHDDSRAIRRSACRLCTPKGRRQATANRHNVEILERLENAVEYYMGLGAGIVENTQLLNAFREVIELHWSVLRGRAIPA